MISFNVWLEAKQGLYQQLLTLRPLIAQAAQKIYDEWEQEDECDVGGICDEIERSTSGIIASRIRNINVTDGGHDGDDHAWTIVYNNAESYGVDIPPHVYETGGGYCWKKIPGVTIQPNHVEVWNLGIHPREFQ
jgi:hypothetical protein